MEVMSGMASGESWLAKKAMRRRTGVVTGGRVYLGSRLHVCHHVGNFFELLVAHQCVFGQALGEKHLKQTNNLKSRRGWAWKTWRDKRREARP